jgi:dTDP-glucose 4,6-dehydratase
MTVRQSRFNPKNMLITGSAGFIGSNFSRMMLREYPKTEVIGYDNLTYASDADSILEFSKSSRYHLVKADIRDDKIFLNTLRKYNIDTIVHFAAESHVDNSISNPSLFFETNVQGTQKILECAKTYWLKEKKFSKNQCRFHHVSTDEVYGSLDSGGAPFVETAQYRPNSPYSASKASSDHVVRAYGKTYGLPITLSNCSNNYGPGQHSEKLIPMVIKNGINQASIPIYGDGLNIRDWLFVFDHCRAIDLIIRSGVIGESYNVGGDNEISNLKLVHLICSMLDRRLPSKKNHERLITFVEDRAGHDFRYAVNMNKIKLSLGFKLTHDFFDALQSTVDSFIKKYKQDPSFI